MKKLISFLLLLTLMLTAPSSSGYNPDPLPEPCAMHIDLEEITITYNPNDAQIAPLTPLLVYNNIYDEEVNRLVINMPKYDMLTNRQTLIPSYYLPTRLWQIPLNKRVLGNETDISLFT